jgi:hypothetical protein
MLWLNGSMSPAQGPLLYPEHQLGGETRFRRKPSAYDRTRDIRGCCVFDTACDVRYEEIAGDQGATWRCRGKTSRGAVTSVFTRGVIRFTNWSRHGAGVFFGGSNCQCVAVGEQALVHGEKEVESAFVWVGY